MTAQWNVVSIDEWTQSVDATQQLTDEPLGTKEKFWVRSPGGNLYLFKYARVRDGRTMGEDWAEWAVHELATLLSIPTATAIPALHNGKRGVLSLSVLRPGDRLIHGNEILAGVDPEYDSQVARQNPRYTVGAVHAALQGVAAPLSCPAPISDAFDVWAGYLMLDAWVAGRDRHHENWAAIEHDGALWLAPSFDHGNALGFQVAAAEATSLSSDEARLGRWASRGRSHHFSGKPSLVQLASAALDLASPAAHGHWLDKLTTVRSEDVAAVVRAVPPGYLSEPERTFREQLLSLNRERILNDD